MTKEDTQRLHSQMRSMISELESALDELESGLKVTRKKKAPNGTFDRTKYQRDYMRAYMARRRRGPKVEVR